MEFEHFIHKILTKYSDRVYTEHQIRKMSPEITKIDHALVRGDLLCCFQDKWRGASTSSPEIESIICHANKLSKLMNIALGKVVLVSKVQCAKIRFKLSCEFKNIFNNYEHEIDKLFGGNNLYEHQSEVVDIFGHSTDSFIVKHPTGTGKTRTIIECIKSHRKTHKGTVLWITKRVDVILSQKNDLPSDFIVCPQSFDYTGVGTYITNTDQLLTFYRTKSFDELMKDIDLLIVDEVHGSGAFKCHYVLNQFACRKIGFSATPFGTKPERNMKISELFPAGILHEFSFFEATERGLILPPTIYFTADDDIELIQKLIGESITGRVILWANTCEGAEKWISKIGHLGEVYRNFGKYSELPVSRLGGKSLLFCVGRCKEGFNMPALDTIINLDCESFDFNVFVQKLGRIVRNYSEGEFTKTRCVYYQKFKTSDKLNLIVALLAGFLGHLRETAIIKSGVSTDGREFVKMNNTQVFIPFDKIEFSELQQALYYSVATIKKMKFASIDEYEKATEKNIRLPKLPEKMNGWCGWENILNIEYYSFEEIKKIYSVSTSKPKKIHYEELRQKLNDPRIPEIRGAIDKYGGLLFIKQLDLF